MQLFYSSLRPLPLQRDLQFWVSIIKRIIWFAASIHHISCNCILLNVYSFSKLVVSVLLFGVSNTGFCYIEATHFKRKWEEVRTWELIWYIIIVHDHAAFRNIWRAKNYVVVNFHTESVIGRTIIYFILCFLSQNSGWPRGVQFQIMHITFIVNNCRISFSFGLNFLCSFVWSFISTENRDPNVWNVTDVLTFVLSVH